MKAQMTWNGKAKRWFKKHEGKQYAVSVSTLAALYPHLVQSHTKEGSARAATQWWAAKLNEVGRHPEHEAITAAIELRQLMALWCQLEHEDELRGLILDEVDRLKRALADRTPVDRKPVPDGSLVATVLGIPLDPFKPSFHLMGHTATPLYHNRTKAEWEANIEQARKHQQWATVHTVNDDLPTLLEMYLDHKEASNGHRTNIKRHITSFINWKQKTEGNTAANSITALTLLNYRKHLMGNGTRGQTSSRELNLVKTFVRWLYEVEVLASLPRNLAIKSKTLSIPREDIHPTTWTDEQIRFILQAPPRVQLYCLLALNCGFYASDIASLKHDEVDWTKGRIKAKRHKTGQGGAFWFELWSTTFALLKEQRSKHPELVLTTEVGTPLWSDEYRRDSVGELFRFWRDKHELMSGCQFKDLRKTGRSKLDSHTEFARYAPTYRQESPKTVDERYYRVPSQAQFSAAIKWLGEQWFTKPI